MNKCALAVLFFLFDRFTGVCGAGRFERGVLAVGIAMVKASFLFVL